MEPLAWATWSLGRAGFSFHGAPADLRAYLLQFWRALARRSLGRCRSHPVVFRWAESGVSSPKLHFPVLPGTYEVGHEAGEWALVSRGHWGIRIGEQSIQVELDRAGWRQHWDVLNQALTFALVLSAGSLGAVSLHGACLETAWGTIVLAGPSQAGKSTLALAAAAAGAALVSDDRVFVSVGPPALTTTLGAPVTFRAGASQLIPDLAPYERGAPAATQTHARRQAQFKIAVDLERAFARPRRLQSALPRALVLLQRDQGARRPRWHKLRAQEALSGFAAADPIPIAGPARQTLLRDLVRRTECWGFAYPSGDASILRRTAHHLLQGPHLSCSGRSI